MALNQTQPAPSDILPQSEIENLLAQVESGALTASENDTSEHIGTSDHLPRHEFPRMSFFSEGELRKLRLRQEEFVISLAGQLSIHLGLEVSLQMSRLETIPFQKFTDGLSNPTHLTLLKLEPLNGICLLDIPPRLGLCMVDRELGGPAVCLDEARDLGKMEIRLLSKIVEMIIGEWCGSWSDLLDLRSVTLKHENNGRFLQTSAPNTLMLVLGIETRIGEVVEQIQIAVPQHMLEPLMLKLNAADAPTSQAATVQPVEPKSWRPALDEIELRITAELPDVEVTSRQLGDLKLGDLITLPTDLAGRVRLCLAGAPKFSGTLGTTNGNWAVKIEQPLKA